jgi:hypothetical protein
LDAMQARDGDGIEAALGLAAKHDRIDREYLEAFCELLDADWHTRHEDVARWLRRILVLHRLDRGHTACGGRRAS